MRVVASARNSLSTSMGASRQGRAENWIINRLCAAAFRLSTGVAGRMARTKRTEAPSVSPK